MGSPEEEKQAGHVYTHQARYRQQYLPDDERIVRLQKPRKCVGGGGDGGSGGSDDDVMMVMMVVAVVMVVM